MFAPPETSSGDCLLIFDRGMVSEENIGELDGSGYDFICGLKKNKVVKAMLREVETAELLSEENFVKDLEEGSKLHAVGMVRELYGKERKVVICYDTKKAASKKRDRDEKLKRAEAELSAYRAKLAKGNYREMEKVVSKVKAIVKGVSTIVIICEYLFYCDFRTAKLTRCLLRIVANNNLPLFPV